MYIAEWRWWVGISYWGTQHHVLYNPQLHLYVHPWRRARWWKRQCLCKRAKMDPWLRWSDIHSLLGKDLAFSMDILNTSSYSSYAIYSCVLDWILYEIVSSMQLFGLFDWSGSNPMPPEFWLFPSFLPMHPGLCYVHQLKFLNLTSTLHLMYFTY